MNIEKSKIYCISYGRRIVRTAFFLWFDKPYGEKFHGLVFQMLPKVSNIIPKVTKYYHKFPNFRTICLPINPYILSSVRYVCRFYHRPWLDVAHLQWFWSKWYGFCIFIVFVVSLLSTCIDIAYLVYLWFMPGKNEWCSGKPKAVRVRLNNNDSELPNNPKGE